MKVNVELNIMTAPGEIIEKSMATRDSMVVGGKQHRGSDGERGVKSERRRSRRKKEDE